MKFRGTLMLVALAIGLMLFVYFYEIRGGKKREEAEEKAKKVVIVEDKQISSIEIIRPGQEPLRVKKNESGSWMLTEPLVARADDGAVGSMTWQLADMNFSQVAADKSAELEEFGLITPEIEVTFETEGAPKTVLFGADTPIGFDTYLQIKGEKRVLVVSRSAKQAFDKQAVDLRDKRVVVFDQADLVGMEITSPEHKIVFEHRDKDWWVTSPGEMDANDETVQGILDQFSTLEAEDFLPEVVARTKNLGEPALTITLIIGEKERARKKVSFWSNVDEKYTLAYPEGEAWYYKVTPYIITDASKSAITFRELRVVKFDRFDLTEMVIRSGVKAEPIVLKKDEKGDWQITEPTSAKGKAAPGKVYDFIDSIEDLKAKEFIDDPPQDSETGLDCKPAIILYGNGEKEGEKKELGRLILGKKFNDATRYARSGGKQVFLVYNAFPLPKGPEAFMETQATPVPEALSPEPE